MTSSHDGDSGRGDSDPDTHYSDVTNEGRKFPFALTSEFLLTILNLVYFLLAF